MDDERLAVLLVEDSPGDARLFEHHLRTDGTTVFAPPELTHVESIDEAIERLAEAVFDLVVLDLGLPTTSGIETLDLLNKRIEDAGIDPLPIVVLTGLNDDETALSAIRRGAQDYLVKDNIDGSTLERAIRHALERHRQEQQLKRQNERLDRFASVISHDLRNPLEAARGTTEILLTRTDDEAPEYEHYERLHTTHERMETIIEDVLALARRGVAVDETVPVDLDDVAAESFETVDRGDARLTVDVDRTIDADPNRLRQLLENLFRNAIEHGSATGEGVQIRVGALPADSGFYVEDDGPGIPERDREQVFEAGYTTDEDGTGLGLNIVADIADAHGWTATVTEGTDGGARFEFRTG